MYLMKSKWCRKFLVALKQSLSSQDGNPPTSALTSALPHPAAKGNCTCPTSPTPPHLPTCCPWAGRGAKNSSRKAPHPGPQLRKINAAQESPLLGGS